MTPGLDFDPLRGGRTLRFSYARATADIVEGVAALASLYGPAVVRVSGCRSGVSRTPATRFLQPLRGKPLRTPVGYLGKNERGKGFGLLLWVFALASRGGLGRGRTGAVQLSCAGAAGPDRKVICWMQAGRR